MAAGATDVGQVRSSNEDRYAILLPPEVSNGLEAVLVVADGMGGHQAGEVASELVVERFSSHFARGDRRQDGELGDVGRTLEWLIQNANAEVRSAGSANPVWRGMGTTVTAVAIAAGRLHLGHVGDTRAFLLRGDQVEQISRDHTWVEEEIRAGHLSISEGRHHPHRNVLTRAVGGADTVAVDLASRELRAGDYVLLCTDGLSNLVSPAEMMDTVRAHDRPAEIVRQLVSLANERGAPDNVTVVVARVQDGGLPPADEEPVSGVSEVRGERAARRVAPAPRRPRQGGSAWFRLSIIFLLVVIGVAVWALARNPLVTRWVAETISVVTAGGG